MTDIKHYRFNIRDAEIVLTSFAFGVHVSIHSYGSGTTTSLLGVPLQDLERGVQMLRETLYESGVGNFPSLAIYLDKEDGLVIQNQNTRIEILANRGDAELALECFEGFVEAAKGVTNAQASKNIA